MTSLILAIHSKTPATPFGNLFSINTIASSLNEIPPAMSTETLKIRLSSVAQSIRSSGCSAGKSSVSSSGEKYLQSLLGIPALRRCKYSLYNTQMNLSVSLVSSLPVLSPPLGFIIPAEKEESMGKQSNRINPAPEREREEREGKIGCTFSEPFAANSVPQSVPH